MKRIFLFFLTFFFTMLSISYADPHTPLVTAALQQKMTPALVLHRLIVGNERFVHQQSTKMDFHEIAALTAKRQHPVATHIDHPI